MQGGDCDSEGDFDNDVIIGIARGGRGVDLAGVLCDNVVQEKRGRYAECQYFKSA